MPRLTIPQMDEIEFQLDECYKEDAQKKLGKSLSFLESIKDFYDRNKFLTPKQRTALADLYERATD